MKITWITSFICLAKNSVYNLVTVGSWLSPIWVLARPSFHHPPAEIIKTFLLSTNTWRNGPGMDLSWFLSPCLTIGKVTETFVSINELYNFIIEMGDISMRMVIVIVMVVYNFYNFYNSTSPYPYYYNNFDIGKVLRGIIETSIFLLHPQHDLPICICLSRISQYHDSISLSIWS